MGERHSSSPLYFDTYVLHTFLRESTKCICTWRDAGRFTGHANGQSKVVGRNMGHPCRGGFGSGIGYYRFCGLIGAAHSASSGRSGQPLCVDGIDGNGSHGTDIGRCIVPYLSRTDRTADRCHHRFARNAGVPVYFNKREVVVRSQNYGVKKNNVTGRETELRRQRQKAAKRCLLTSAKGRNGRFAWIQWSRKINVNAFVSVRSETEFGLY